MLRRLIRGLTLCGCVMLRGSGASTATSRLSADVAEAARDAHNYMKSDLVPGIGTARFADAIAASRAKVRIAQSKVSADADKGVWLVLMMVNVKSNESNGASELARTVSVAPSRAAREAAQDLANELDHCMSEAEG